ncbi:MAG TPA: alkaline phosphatase family protein [Acidimicrobiales bacterium]|nr:alkaline phosphatase family protein [Acidimicrobiales bacterium]
MTGKLGRYRLGAGGASLLVAAALVTALALPATATASSSAGERAASSPLPPIHHVFVIALENEGYANTFGDPGADPYLATTLPSQGALLTQYYGTGHESNDNYIAMISGQGPNPQNQADCQWYDDFVPPGITVAPGQAVGTGCVYPRSVQTVANQLSAAHLTWKGYMQDMGNDPSRESPVCGHPAVNSQDNTQSAVPGDGYVTRHDPFVYFHSIINNTAYCDQHVVPLGSTTGAMPPGTPAGTTGLVTDLKSTATTPNFSFITPNVCNDGHDYPCTNQPSGSSALADIDAFLSTWVPIITSSPAFRQNGLLVITFDESKGPQSDSRACCGEGPGPDSPLPGITGLGGGQVGAVLLSPFIDPGTRSSTPYNHYSLLASVEDIFHLPHLGYARTVTTSFGSDIFTR